MSKRLTTEEFIEKAVKVHGDKYNYSLVNYIDCKTKVKIICKEHGVFEQNLECHIRLKCGCPICNLGGRLSLEEFISKSNKKHNYRYDYSLVEYEKSIIPVKIICPDHGVFKQRPLEHLRGCGCKKCTRPYKNTDIIIKEFENIHKHRYDYSLIEYKSMHTKVKIICKIHGIFEQQPANHLMGQGCPICNSNKLNREIFIKKSEKIHSEKYDYSLVDYINNGTKVKIICKNHGVFEQRPNSHLKGYGCSKCRKLCITDFVERSNKIHYNKYDYSMVILIDTIKKVKILCPEHGIFEQTPNRHLSGNGCPKCRISKGELKIINYLKVKNIKYEYQKIFDNCKDLYKLPFDFYLPEHNICIEFDGIQHFKPIEYWGGVKTLKYIQKHDKIKNEYCLKNNIRLIRISNITKVEFALTLLGQEL